MKNHSVHRIEAYIRQKHPRNAYVVKLLQYFQILFKGWQKSGTILITNKHTLSM